MGPWGQAEGLSEPSLLLQWCLEKEGKAVCTAACPCIPSACLRGQGTALRPPPMELLMGTSHTSHSGTLSLAAGWGGGHGRGLWDAPKAG